MRVTARDCPTYIEAQTGNMLVHDVGVETDSTFTHTNCGFDVGSYTASDLFSIKCCFRFVTVHTRMLHGEYIYTVESFESNIRQ